MLATVILVVATLLPLTIVLLMAAMLAGLSTALILLLPVLVATLLLAITIVLLMIALLAILIAHLRFSPRVMHAEIDVSKERTVLKRFGFVGQRCCLLIKYYA